MFQLWLLIFAGCATDQNVPDAISRTGSERVALFKENLVSNVNQHFDDAAKQAIDKGKIDGTKGLGRGITYTKRPSGVLYMWISGTCKDDAMFVSRSYLDEYMIPEEGRIECLNIEISQQFIACIRDGFEVSAPGFPLGVHFALDDSSKKQDSKTLRITHITINIREESRWEQIDITIASCPEDVSLEVCIFDYSPIAFVKQGSRTLRSGHILQPFSAADATDSNLLEKALEQMGPESRRVLGMLVRRRILTPDHNSCPQGQLYSIN
jgi:hypothetical protein